VCPHPRHLDPDDVWSTIEREKVNLLTIVGDAFGRPLVDQLAKKLRPLSFVLIGSGGAILSAALKDEFLAPLPNIRILDALGSSESGAQASQFSEGGKKATTGDFAARRRATSC
jgi:3-oxocholest-4-en-26-oate---CoA ligase